MRIHSHHSHPRASPRSKATGDRPGLTSRPPVRNFPSVLGSHEDNRAALHGSGRESRLQGAQAKDSPTQTLGKAIPCLLELILGTTFASK